jgi:hypothetical protein
MNLRKLLLGVFFALTCWSRHSLADDAEYFPSKDAPGTPNVMFGVLGGVAMPFCRSQQGCDGHLSTGPSLGAVVLYAPNNRWAIGVGVEAARTHWREPYVGMTDGKTYQIDTDLTAGFAALAMRYTPFPQQSLTPIVQAALGSGFQTQTGTNLQCNDGFIPTTQIALGVREQASPSFSFFGLASARLGFKLSDCGVSDGPGTTPFAGWGFGLHLGAAFDFSRD